MVVQLLSFRRHCTKQSSSCICKIFSLQPFFFIYKKIFLFGTAGFGGSEAYFKRILDKTKESLDASNTVVGEFMCQGKMPQSVRERYEKMKEQPDHMPNIDAMIENFDKALAHPDDNDLNTLKQLVANNAQ